jgi:hypothetical protein
MTAPSSQNVNQGASRVIAYGATVGDAEETQAAIKSIATSFSCFKDSGLINLPDLEKRLSAIFVLESQLSCFPVKGSTNSRHKTIVCGSSAISNGNISNKVSSWTSGTSFFTNYWNSNVVQNYLACCGGVQDEAVKDGLYAHGVSACMGAYHVKFTPAWNELFGQTKYRSIVNNYGLEVQIGTSVTSIYPKNDKYNREKSIAAGMIIFDSKFSAYVNKPATLGILTKLSPVAGVVMPKTGDKISPEVASLLAGGAYLGFGADANNVTGIERMIAIQGLLSKNELFAASGSTLSTTDMTNAPPGRRPGCTA